MITLCLNCHTPFKTYRRRRKYCSHPCFLKSPKNTTDKLGTNNVSKRPDVRSKMSKARKGKKPWNKGKKNQYHLWPKGRKIPKMYGINNHRFKGGHIDKSTGYRKISIEGKIIFEHRHVMQIFIGRKLLSSEIIHHLNGNKLDNRIENLIIVSRSEHKKLHSKL